jgi:hypothetical protein
LFLSILWQSGSIYSEFNGLPLVVVEEEEEVVVVVEAVVVVVFSVGNYTTTAARLTSAILTKALHSSMLTDVPTAEEGSV